MNYNTEYISLYNNGLKIIELIIAYEVEKDIINKANMLIEIEKGLNTFTCSLSEAINDYYNSPDTLSELILSNEELNGYKGTIDYRIYHQIRDKMAEDDIDIDDYVELLQEEVEIFYKVRNGLKTREEMRIMNMVYYFEKKNLFADNMPRIAQLLEMLIMVFNRSKLPEADIQRLIDMIRELLDEKYVDIIMKYERNVELLINDYFKRQNDKVKASNRPQISKGIKLLFEQYRMRYDNDCTEDEVILQEGKKVILQKPKKFGNSLIFNNKEKDSIRSKLDNVNIKLLNSEKQNVTTLYLKKQDSIRMIEDIQNLYKKNGKTLTKYEILTQIFKNYINSNMK